MIPHSYSCLQWNAAEHNEIKASRKIPNALEIVAEFCSELKMSVENETSCPRIILLLSSICTSDFSRQEGCIQSGGISTSVDSFC